MGGETDRQAETERKGKIETARTDRDILKQRKT